MHQQKTLPYPGPCLHPAATGRTEEGRPCQQVWAFQREKWLHEVRQLSAGKLRWYEKELLSSSRALD